MADHITPEEHSDIVGGSTAARRIGCPASYRLEKLVPKDERGSEYAREGTALHELMAMTLRDGVEPTDMLPYTFTAADGSWSFTVTEDLWADKGEPALAAFDRYVASIEQQIGEDMEFLVERRVAFPGIPGAFGTSDIIGRCGDEIFVMDWKFGFKPVSPVANKQLLFYASGALNTEAGWVGPTDDDTPLTLVIIQPMARQSGQEILQEWPTTVGALMAYQRDLKAAVAEARREDATCRRGDWCTFARCKTVCPAHLNPLGGLAARFDELTAAQQKSNGSPMDRLDWAQRYADLLEMAEIAEAVAAEVFAQAHAYADQGNTIPGWALEAKKAGARTWAVEERQLKTFFRRHRIKQDQWSERKMRSPAQMEKILKQMNIHLPEKLVAPGVSSGTKLSRTEKVARPVESRAARMLDLGAKLARMG